MESCFEFILIVEKLISKLFKSLPWKWTFDILVYETTDFHKITEFK